MSYKRAEAGRYVNRIRRYIDQFPLKNEEVTKEEDAAESTSTQISDDFIIKSINSAQRSIVARAKACHVYDVISTENSASPTGVIVRLLYGSQKADYGSGFQRAVHRDVDRARRLEGTGSKGAESGPVVTYDSGNIQFYPDTHSNVEVRYVGMPSAVSALTDELDVDERFEAAIVYYGGAECFQRLRLKPLEQLSLRQYEDEMQAFGLGTRASPLDKTEVDTE